MKQETRTVVIELLTKYPTFRDSDEQLVAWIWGLEMNAKGYSTGTLPTQKFLRILADGQLTSSDSITRMRRKAQEEHPELRGTKYNQRQDRQSSVKKDLGYGQ
jgi:hypothetical protein